MIDDEAAVVPRIVPVTEAMIDDAAAVLAGALHNDPFFAYVLPDPVARAERLPMLLSALVRFGVLFGGAVAADGGGGVAVWQRPGVDVTPERARAARFELVGEALGDVGLQRYGAVMDYLQPVAGRDMPGAAWYLMAIGVARGMQRRGIGTALLASMLAEADATALPSYLHTFQRVDVQFYESLGFDMLSDTTEPESDLRVWGLGRDPLPRR